MKKSFLPLALCLFLLLGLASCSSDSEGPSNPETIGTAGDVVTMTITPSGGTLTALTLEGVAVTLTLPPGAVGAPTDITLQPVPASNDALFSVLIEPAGLVLFAAAVITVTVPDNATLADQNLFFGSPGAATFFPTTVDSLSRTLTGTIRGFGLPVDYFGEATAPSGTAKTAAPNNLGSMPLTCAQLLAEAQASFDAFVAQDNVEGAINVALESASLLAKATCPEAQTWLATVEDLTCNRLEAALTSAGSASINGYGDFDSHVSPIIHWMGVAEQLSPQCQAAEAVSTTITGVIDKFLAWYGPRLQTMNTPDFATFVALKQELLSLADLNTELMFLGLDEIALLVENRAINPTLGQMRDIAYALGRNHRWHFALTKLTTYGFFAGRDIIGVEDPRLCDTTFSPPRCYQPPSRFGVLTSGPFSNDDIYKDLQYCGTDIEFKARVASGSVLDSTSIGGGGSPGQETDGITISCPTRGMIELGGEIAAMTCFTTDDDADNEIIVALNGTDVLTLRRPIGGDEYLQGTPAEIDIIQAAEEANITPMAGVSHDLTIRRNRTECSDVLWGDREFTFMRTTLQWVNPTLEVEVQVPPSVQPGATVNVDVRVKVIDQLGQAGFFDAIDVVLQASGGTLQQLTGQTDAQGYFQTQVTADGTNQPRDGDGKILQGLQIDATATSFEGVTAQGSASTSVGKIGYARLVSVEYGGLVRSTGFRVAVEREDVQTTSGPWSYAATVQSDSSSDGKTYSGSATINSTAGITVSGDTLTAVAGTFDGSCHLDADGGFMAVEIPEALQLTEMTLVFEVVGGPIGAFLSADLTAVGLFEGFLDLNGRGLDPFDRLQPPPATYTEELGFGPGLNTITVLAQTRVSCGTCVESGNLTMDFLISLGGPYQGGGLATRR